MGGVQAKKKTSVVEVEEGLREKVRILEREMGEIMVTRETESQAFDEEMMVFVLKEGEWMGERKKLMEEIRRLREEKDGSSEEERRRRRRSNCRDEAVERWKKLYLAIKVELDHLMIIHNTTHHHLQGGDWRSSAKVEVEEENEELKRRVREKEERIEILEAKLVSMEQEEMRKEREMDILRQSLRIMCHNNNINNNLKMMMIKNNKKKMIMKKKNQIP